MGLSDVFCIFVGFFGLRTYELASVYVGDLCVCVCKFVYMGVCDCVCM